MTLLKKEIEVNLLDQKKYKDRNYLYTSFLCPIDTISTVTMLSFIIDKTR
jgi:hypothetical protein